MLLFITCLLLILFNSAVKSDEISDSKWMDMKNNTISVTKYCEDKNCIVKCCPEGKFIAAALGKGITCVQPKNPNVIKKLNYSGINVYKWNGVTNEVVDTTKHPQSKIAFVQNEILSNPIRTTIRVDCSIHIMENGTLKTNGSCGDEPKLSYCVDFYRTSKKNPVTGVPVPEVLLVYKIPIDYDADAKVKHAFVAAGMLTSAFFMLLVLLVYGLLPRLRNIVGMVLMAYLLTEIVAYVMKAAQLIALNAETIDAESCRRTSPAVYYFILAGFFWLNVMSFDLWWTIRGSRKRRDIHRQGELIKFLWYCVYAWGTPALVTIMTVLVDRLKWYKDDNYKPPFDSCFKNAFPTAIYLHVAIGVMTFANWVLFLMTAYNIWLIKRAVSVSKESRNTKSSENRFAIYIKLSVLMGVSWVLELVPILPLIPHIIINFYNVFIGVAIFIIFVCKKSIFIMLCKRFDLKSKLVDKLQSSQYNKSETTKSSTNRRSRYIPEKDDNETELTTYTTEMT